MRIKMIFVMFVAVSFNSEVIAKSKKERFRASGNQRNVSTDDSRTNIDFNETLIEGQTKAPQGFLLQGHQSQSLSNMVKLRSDFKSELRNSKDAVHALVR